MDSDLRQSMFRYYDERAPEYEEAYLMGTGTASILDPRVFLAEIPMLEHVVERFGHGRIIDVACGTAYWLSRYARRCSHITLLDQSERMLAESRKKAASLGILDRCSIVRADLLDYECPRGSYDSALDDDGEFLILDSAWSAQRAEVNTKVGHQERRLNDGTRFEIYKRYLDEGDIRGWGDRYGVTLRVEHLGTAFLAVSGRFRR